MIFICVMNYIVALQVVSLLVWPDFIAFQGGVFTTVTATSPAIEKSLALLSAFSLGWFIVLVFDRCDIALEIDAINSKAETHLSFFVGWFFISIIVSILGALFLDLGIAGVESDFQYAGILYYLFPVDYLVLVLVAALGLKIDKIKGKEKFFWLLIALYLVVKILCGWKSPLLNVFLVYTVGVYYRQGIRVILRLLPLGVLVLAGYIFAIKPIVEFVRTGEVDAGSYAEQSLDYNPFAGRLTEGTLFGIAVIELDGETTKIAMLDFLGDFVNRLVPGTLWDIKTIDRVFTEDVLGQHEGVASTFAPGMLGMAQMLGGVFAAIMYGIFFRFLVFLLGRWGVSARQAIVKLYVIGVIPIFVVSLCIDGYFGGFEKLAVLGVVIAIFIRCCDYFNKWIPMRRQRV
ncbi:hypothetical protein C2U69_11705 [Cupriavidus pinatubonensis]|nr:hypothetical protein C2U69_11705 [Cupriavidus pinatubonensis]